MDRKKFDELVKKIDSFKKDGGVDLTVAEDLSIAVMNLISLEEHFFFTGEKTKKDEYFDFSKEIRSVRRELLEKLMPNHEGETWCISKHLLASSMRLIEVGNRYMTDGKKDEAKDMFDKAYKVYSIFWGLKLKLMEVKDLKTSGDKKVGEEKWTVEDLVSKLADCCNE